MDQQAYEIFMFITEIYEFILETTTILLLARVFCHPGKKQGSAAAMGIFVILNFVLWFRTPVYIQYTLLILIMWGYCYWKYKKYYEKTVFVLLLSLNIWSLSSLIGYCIYHFAWEQLKKLDIYSPVFKMNECVALARIVYMLAYTILLLAMTALIGKVVKKPFDFRWPETICLSVINIIGAMFTRMIYDLLQVRMKYEMFFLFSERKDWLWKVPVIAVLLYAGETAAIYGWQKFIELQGEKQRHFIKEQQITMMKERLAEAENIYSGIRQVRHEMKNHMTNIKGLAASEKYQELENYIDRLDDSVGKLEYQFTTGNAVADVILNDKYQKAQRSGTLFHMNFSWEKTDTVSIFDMGIILSNLLDNAIEACEKLERGERYINLTLRRKERFLLLEAENRFDGEISFEKGSNLPATSKKVELPETAIEHGIGLKNVKNVAERYLGGVTVRAEDHVFRITVMLQQK